MKHRLFIRTAKSFQGVSLLWSIQAENYVMLYLLQVTGRHLWFHKHPDRRCTLFSTIMSCCLTPENLSIVVGILFLSCIEADIYVVISKIVLDFCCHLWCFKHPNVRHSFPEFRHVAWHRKHGHSRWNFRCHLVRKLRCAAIFASCPLGWLRDISDSVTDATSVKI